MCLHEQIAVQIAKARIDDAMRTAEQRRAMCFARGKMSVRVSLGRALMRLGHWMMNNPNPTKPSHRQDAKAATATEIPTGSTPSTSPRRVLLDRESQPS